MKAKSYKTVSRMCTRIAPRRLAFVGDHTPLLSMTSFLLALCMIWSFVVAPCVLAAHVPAPQKRRPHTPWLSPNITGAMKARMRQVAVAQKRAQKPGFPYRQATAQRAAAARNPIHTFQGAVAPASLQTSLTLLDEVGLLARHVPMAEALGWSRELAMAHPSTSRAALLHLRLGEWQLAHNQQPETARAHFALVRHLTEPTEKLYGLAAYDQATAAYYQGAYAEAVSEFNQLMVGKPRLFGFDRRSAALWMRHAGASAGYHADRANAGIPEPTRLDPLCGAASLATSLKAAGRPYDKKTVLSVMHVTGEGSSLGDLVAAARRLGLSARTVRADDQGLISLPKPLVAYVEHDHFVSVTRADAKGVSYLCSDCGLWPGGRVNLSWKQWHLLNGGLYLTLTIPGSPNDRALAELSKDDVASGIAIGQGASPVTYLNVNSSSQLIHTPTLVAYAEPFPELHLSLHFHLPAVSNPPFTVNLLSHFASMRGHIVLVHNPPVGIYCGAKPGGLQCESPTCCPEGDIGPGGGDLGPPQDGPVSPPVPGGPPGGGLQAKGYKDGNLHGVSAILHDKNSRQVASASTKRFDIPLNGIPALGPTLGDPVNLATGEEEYKPKDDLTIYNPHGPSVVWARYYNSLRRPGQGYIGDSAGDDNYEMNDFGVGWSRSYNVGVYDPTNGTGGSAPNAIRNGGVRPNATTGITNAAKYVFFENGSRQSFTSPSVPTASAPQVLCTTQSGCPFIVYWNYAASGNYYTIVLPNRAQWITTAAISGLPSCYALSKLVDRNGHSITFNYSPAPSGTTFSWPLLSSIVNEDGTTLLNVVRVGDGSGNIAEVNDCYGRSVLYHVSDYAVYSGNPNYTGKVFYAELDHVSQLAPIGTPNPADRYVYGYENMGNGYAFLHTISVPNPSGGAAPATATLDYDPNTYFVTKITDANAYTTSFASVSVSSSAGSGGPGSANGPSGTLSVSSMATPTDYTQVTVSGGGTTLSYISGYDMNMSSAIRTDGVGTVTASSVFDATSVDPFRPTSTTDGDGRTTHFVWDPFGNLLQMTDARGVVTQYTYGYPSSTLSQYSALSSLPNTTLKSDAFAMGELLSVQKIGSQSTKKAATTYAYFEPSGLLSQITKPQPGYLGANAPSVTTSFAYDNYGNRTRFTSPGNNAVSSMVSTLFYGNGTNVKINQPLIVTNNLGQTSQYTYDAQGNRTSLTDALGKVTYYGDSNGQNGYNIANQPLLMTYPPTNQTGTGSSSVVRSYLYPGGPNIATKTDDESGQLTREEDLQYGPEGEVRGVSGGTEPIRYTYDCRYHLTSVLDGAGNATHYFYNASGYLYQVAYPGSGATNQPALVGSADTTTYASYDAVGHLLSRTDGNNVTTKYTYSDPKNYLTQILYSYPAGYAGNRKPVTNISYDQFGRMVTANDGISAEVHGYTDSNGVVQPSYDDGDRVLSTKTTYYDANSNALFAATMSYAFYADGTRQTLNTPAGSFSYSYDGIGRLSSLTNPANETYQWSYWNNNRLRTQVLADGAVTTYSLNSLGKVVDQQTTIGGNPVSDFSNQTYDGNGNLTSQVNALVGQPSFSGQKTYAYDNRSNLTKEGPTTYSYDGVGAGTTSGPANPTIMRGSSQTFSGDGDNKLINYNGNASFTYDGNGSPTVFAGQPLAFDSENHLIACGAGLTNTYSTTGRRASKNTNNTTTYFLYDGPQVVCEMNSSGAILATNTFGRSGLVARTSNATSVQYVFDTQGNVAQRLNNTGGTISSDMYDAFGHQNTTATTPDPFGFGARWGYYTDTEIGFVLLGDRFYNPSSGRFLTRDAIGYKGGANLYNYVKNNPINCLDPTGYQVIGPIEVGPIESSPTFDPRPVMDQFGPPAPTPVSPDPIPTPGPRPFPLPGPPPFFPPPGGSGSGSGEDNCDHCVLDSADPVTGLGGDIMAFQCNFTCTNPITGDTYSHTVNVLPNEECPDLSNKPKFDPPDGSGGYGSPGGPIC